MLVSISCVCAGRAARIRARVESHVAAGVLFAAHPVHVEAVVQGVNQGELLVAIFSLVAVCRYVDARRAGSLGARDRRVLAALYLLAILTKENAFVLPGLFVAAELFLVRDKPLAERVSALWRGYAMLGAIAVVLVGVRALFSPAASSVRSQPRRSSGCSLAVGC